MSATSNTTQILHDATVLFATANSTVSRPIFAAKDLPTSHFQDTDTKCPICRCDDSADIDSTDTALLTQIVCIYVCSHIFHRICLKLWIDGQIARENKGTCPMYRAVLVQSAQQSCKQLIQELLANISSSHNTETLTGVREFIETELNTVDHEQAMHAQVIVHTEQRLYIPSLGRATQQIQQEIYQIIVQIRERGVEITRLSRRTERKRTPRQEPSMRRGQTTLQIEQEIRGMNMMMRERVLETRRLWNSPTEISRELRNLADETFRLDQRTCELQVIRETLDEICHFGRE
ncbi:hypothetical protein HBI81_050240 [Parastagonospora nodorum]|nr:hypothetical protein HBI50_163160 [Parastagonospora nodorum]KAH5320755.1 hypothetical protein HBI11_047900 [Parastagonospora nodorum]KAH5460282.1 hypothetical protein HBI30_034290 [Parastagonospora nodorum]KAH6418707.1 hypothetical protein HBI08_095350 [Parastagonospora nodorum]KAH6539052.1 hypothetical protein HBI81_050240 [Parastagonospora nodorum]